MASLVDRAAGFAQAIHLGDIRKGSERPYFDAHLEPVAQLVRRAGGTEEQVAAAYLHDTVEDGGGTRVLDEIRRRFGDAVAEMVRSLSDSVVDTRSGQAKEAWIIRKARYVEHLSSASPEALAVSVADKLHNASSILADHAELGDEIWQRFSRHEPAAHVWYYGSLAERFTELLPGHPLAGELAEVVEALTELAGVADDEIEAVAEEAVNALAHHRRAG